MWNGEKKKSMHLCISRFYGHLMHAVARKPEFDPPLKPQLCINSFVRAVSIKNKVVSHTL